MAKFNKTLHNCEFTTAFKEIRRYCEEADKARDGYLRLIGRLSKDTNKLRAENEHLKAEVKELRKIKRKVRNLLKKEDLDK